MGAGEWESRWPTGTRSGRPLGGSERKGRMESGSGGGGREGAGWNGGSVGSWGETVTLSSNHFQSTLSQAFIWLARKVCHGARSSINNIFTASAKNLSQ